MLQVPTSTTIVLIFNALLGLILPAFLFFFFKKRGAGQKNFWVGCLVMLVFAFGLESVANALISAKIFSSGAINVWKYAIYGGLMAGIFEETGRFIAFKYVLKKTAASPKDALMYGAGHGGLELFVILVLTAFGNLFFSFLINHNATDYITKVLSGEALSNVQTQFYLLCTTPFAQFLMAPWERLSAIIAQLALSVIVWKAVSAGGKFILLYPLAIVLHMVINSVAVLCSSQFHIHVILIEAIVMVIAILYGIFAMCLCQKELKR